MNNWILGAWVMLSVCAVACQQQGTESRETVLREEKTPDYISEPVEARESGESGEAGENGKAAVLSFTEDSYHFGDVTEGHQVEYEFVFTNEGNEPLIIGQVTASCGCTTPEYSRKPVAPGEKGKIKVVFDSNGQVGKQHKIITVMTNAKDGVGLLHLRGEVHSKKQLNTIR